MEQTCLFQSWKLSNSAVVLIWLGMSYLDLVRAGGRRKLCAQGGNSYRRKRREGEGEASSLSSSTECDVGCRAAVLFLAMLVLSGVSSQHMWEGTVLQDRKSCCTTVQWAVSLWYCLGWRQVKGRRLGP